MHALPRLPRVLVTNDDGIEAPGLAVLTAVAETFAHEVWVVAPQHDESGTGQSLSLHHPLRAWPKGKRRWAINGTPADCVALAVSHLLKERPSLILAGVNAGTNVGDDANLSGTLGAALTGLMLDVPSIAFSQACVSRQNVKWKTAKAVVPKLLAHFLAEGWRKDTCLSVNIPDLDAEAISGFSWALQDSKTIAGLRVEEREDMREQNYYWLTFLDRDTPPKSGSDRAVLARGEISVTALTLDRSVKVDAPSVLFADAALVADE